MANLDDIGNKVRCRFEAYMSKSSKNHRTQIHRLTTNTMSTNNVKRVVLSFRSRHFLLFSFIPKGYRLAAFYGDKNEIRVSQVDIISGSLRSTKKQNQIKEKQNACSNTLLY